MSNKDHAKHLENFLEFIKKSEGTPWTSRKLMKEPMDTTIMKILVKYKVAVKSSEIEVEEITNSNWILFFP